MPIAAYDNLSAFKLYMADHKDKIIGMALAFLNVITPAQPEVYMGAYHTLIDRNSSLSTNSKLILIIFISKIVIRINLIYNNA